MKKGNLIIALGFVLVGIGLSISQVASPRREARWAGTRSAPTGWDNYYAFLWMYQGPDRSAQLADALMRLGVNGINVYDQEPTSDFAAQSGMKFYVDNIAGKGDLYLDRGEWQRTWDAYWRTRDKAHLVRPRCLSDPLVIERMRKKIKQTIAMHKNKSPLAYSLDDEISVTSFANPFDFCFGPYCLKKFRTWLADRYRELDVLNKQWETSFKSWDEVVPMTTDEIRRREFGKNLEKYNFSPWADHRTFMDDVFAQTLKLLIDYAHQLDPRTPVGFTGGQAPSAFGGYDWWKIMQVVEFLEPYDIGCSREIVRSFDTKNIPIVQTLSKGVERDQENIWKLWYYLAHGDRGSILWSSGDYFKDKDPGQPTPYAQSLVKTFKALTSYDIVRIITAGKFEHDPIAIYYSQPSIQAHWMLDSKGDGETWPKRFTSFEVSHSSMLRSFEAWQKVLEDIGFQYNFVSYEQVKSGELIKQKYKVLIMPKTIALSDKEASEIINFIKQGGTVIADYQTAVMDEHCRSLPKGKLDDVFGIRRKDFNVAERYGDLRPVIPIIEGSFKDMPIAESSLSATTAAPMEKIRGTPCVLSNKWERGKAIYLNLGIMRYAAARFEPGHGKEIRGLIQELLRDAGLNPRLTVLSEGRELPHCERIFYRSAGNKYLFVLHNKMHASGGNKIVGLKTEPVKIKLVFLSPVRLRNLRTGRSFPSGKEVEDAFMPYEANVYRVD